MNMSEDIPQDSEQRQAQAAARVIPIREANRDVHLDLRALAQGEPPKRQWALEGWIGMGHVTLLAGRGGIGKSIVAQQLGSSIAMGQDFIVQSQQKNVLFWAGEDDHDELWRRQIAIAGKLDRPLGDFADHLYLIPLASEECALMDEVQGELIRTSILKELRDQIERWNIGLVILDNIARVYGGNENDRHHVTAFLAALNWACEPTGAACLLLGHVAKSKESEYSGSTAWENAVRSRLWITDKKPDAPDKESDEEPPEDVRYFAKRKTNYSSRDIAKLRYVDGAYDVLTAPARGGLISALENRNAKALVLRCLPKLLDMGYFATASPNSPNYLPKLLATHGMADGFARGDLARAVRELMVEGQIHIGPLGRRGNRHHVAGLLCGPKSNGQEHPPEA
jgi:hypothetical protein